MRLLRVGEPGRERPCVGREDGTVVDVSSLVDDFDGGFLAGGGVERLRAEMSSRTDLPVVDVDAERIGPCVARPPKVVCIGLNYVDHAEESGQQVPTEPVVFFKASSTVTFSSTVTDGPSPLVPKAATPATPCSASHATWRR